MQTVGALNIKDLFSGDFATIYKKIKKCGRMNCIAKVLDLF